MPTTLAPSHSRAVRAWLTYSETLRGLAGLEYERAEAEAWELLQAALAAARAEAAASRGELG